MHTHITTPCSSSRWTGIRHVSLQREDGLDYRLQFGMEAATFTPLELNDNANTIISRGISTVPLTLIFPAMSTTTATDAMTTTEISTTNTEAVDTQSGTMDITEISTDAEDLEDNILEHIKETPTFNRVRAMVSECGGWLIMSLDKTYLYRAYQLKTCSFLHVSMVENRAEFLKCVENFALSYTSPTCMKSIFLSSDMCT